jgi:hypothetical protein
MKYLQVSIRSILFVWKKNQKSSINMYGFFKIYNFGLTIVKTSSKFQLVTYYFFKLKKYDSFSFKSVFEN